MLLLCANKEELRAAVEKTLGQQGVYGDVSLGLVIQERIKGDEYIVNTVSCDGIPRITTIWRYYKKQTAEGNYIYDYMKSVNELDIAQQKWSNMLTKSQTL